MKINLSKSEVYKILQEKFVVEDVVFELVYVESDKLFEARTGKRIQDLETPPKKEGCILYFEDEVTKPDF